MIIGHCLKIFRAFFYVHRFIDFHLDLLAAPTLF